MLINAMFLFVRFTAVSFKKEFWLNILIVCFRIFNCACKDHARHFILICDFSSSDVSFILLNPHHHHHHVPEGLGMFPVS